MVPFTQVAQRSIYGQPRFGTSQQQLETLHARLQRRAERRGVDKAAVRSPPGAGASRKQAASAAALAAARRPATDGLSDDSDTDDGRSSGSSDASTSDSDSDRPLLRPSGGMAKLQLSSGAGVWMAGRPGAAAKQRPGEPYRRKPFRKPEREKPPPVKKDGNRFHDFDDLGAEEEEEVRRAPFPIKAAAPASSGLSPEPPAYRGACLLVLACWYETRTSRAAAWLPVVSGQKSMCWDDNTPDEVEIRLLHPGAAYS